MAMKTTATRHIAASPEAVWQIVTETETWTQWHPEIRSAFWVSKLVEWVKGATIRVAQAMPSPFGTVTLIYRVGRVEDRQFTEWDARGNGLDLSGHIRLEAVGSGTKVTWFESIGGLKATVLSWRLQPQRQEIATELLARLAALAEQPQPQIP